MRLKRWITMSVCPYVCRCRRYSSWELILRKKNTEKNDECLSVPASVWDKMTKIKTRIMYLYVHCRRRRRMSYAVRDPIPLTCMWDEEVWQPTPVHFVLGRTVRTSVVSVTKQRARIRAKNQRTINQSFHDVTRCVSFYVPSEWNTRREKKQKQKNSVSCVSI